MAIDFKEFIRGLKPLFKRNGVADALESIRDEISNTAIPYYETSASLLQKGESALWKLADKDLHQRLTRVRSGSWVENVHLALRNAVELIPEIVKRVNKNLEIDVAADGLSFKEAALVRLVESLSFYVGYARTLLRATIICESMPGGDKALGEFFTKNDIAYLTANMYGFAIATEVLCGQKQQILAGLDKIPDVIVSDEDGVGNGLYNAGNTDPMRLGMWNPQMTNSWIYRFRIYRSEKEEAALQVAKEEAQALEYWILSLKQQQQNAGNDPKIQQQIEYHEERLKKLRYDIKRKEEAAV
ncbi:hypothetical protein O8H94_001189 [Escherichia coli O157]|nr:hypothetical protein [Escherichia coli O157]EKH6024657.1 hypothetical protein [Escherichia coli O157]EKH6093843.1 hypothetical protein [Escherichia coli O157]